MKTALWSLVVHQFGLQLLSYDNLSKKPLLFKSFTGLSVQQFDDIYNKEITKRYHDYELKRLSKRKDRKRSIGAGRPFKLDVRDRFVILLVYYRLYITYTLAGFLFDLDQSNICRDIKKIESLVRKCLSIPQKIWHNKESPNSWWSWEIFSRLSCFYRLYRTANSKTSGWKEEESILFWKEEKAYYKDTVYG